MLRRLLLPLPLLLPAALSAQTSTLVPPAPPLPKPAPLRPVHPHAAQPHKAAHTVPVLTPRSGHAAKHAPAHRTAPPPATRVPPAPPTATAPAAKPPAASAPPAPPPPPPPTDKGSVTGLPLPRFAALKSGDVNLRTGPGQRYPVDWVYKRRDLPVKIEREFDVWRLVEDMDGTKGWVHQATLTGHRSFVVTGATSATMRAKDSVDSDAVAVLEPGVVGRIKSCASNAGWCTVEAGGYSGFLKRTDFYGTLPGEPVAP